MPILPYATKGVSAAAGGQTLYDAVVPTDYATVGAAITAGKVAIFVKSGTITESAITDATDNITITGADPKSSVLSFGANNFTLNGAYVTLQNIAISTSTGITTLGGNYGTLDNVHFVSSNSTNNVLAVTGLGASVNNIRLVDSASAGSATYRFNFGAQNITVTNSLFLTSRNGTAALIFLGQSSSMSACTFYLNGGAQGGAYMVEATTKAVVSGCAFYNQAATDGCIKLSGVGATAVGNTMDGGANGILLANTANSCLVNGNTYYSGSAGATAINCAGALNVISGNLIRHRSTVGATALGIVVAASKNNNTITGNLVTNAFVGLTINTGATNTVVVGNTFTGNGTNLTDNGTTTVNTGNVTT